jgi:peptidoglycan/xylan/chitin deacetylase (PgdA/CDA1 family)
MNKVINFHKVNSIDWFDGMICFLKSKYKFICIDTLQGFYSGQIDMKDSCHITVDDGDRTFYDIIYPVLKKHQVPASLFVSPKICEEQLNYWFQEIEGYAPNELKRIIADMLKIPYYSIKKYSIASVLKTMPVARIHETIKRYKEITNTPSKPFQNMSVKELQEVDRSGLVTIGAHTVNHPILNNEDDTNSEFEIAGSVEGLATLLNHEIKYFAYPNGIPMFDFTDREEATLKLCKIELAFSTVARNMTRGDNKLRIPRIGISDAENMFFAKTKLSMGSSWDTLKKLKTNGEYIERKKLKQLLNDTV